MAKIANLDIKDRYPVAVAQLKDDLVINTAVYDSSSLYPRSFKNISFNSGNGQVSSHITGTVDHSNNPNRVDSQGAYSSLYTARGRRSGNFTYGANFMVDSADSNIGWYVVPDGDPTSDNVIIYKVSLVTKEILASTQANPCYIAHFVGQDADNLHVAFMHTASGYAYTQIQAVSKTTMAWGDSAASSSYRYGQYTYMTEDAAIMWVTGSRAYNNSATMYYELDKGTSQWTGPTILQASPNTDIDCNSTPSQTRVIDADNDAAYVTWPTSNTANVYEIYKINCDKSGQSITSTICTLDFTTAGVTRSDELAIMTNVGTANNTVETWLVTGGSSDYVCFTVSEKPNHTTEVAATFNIYIFKIETTDTNLTYIGKIDPAVRLRCVMPLEEDWTKIAVVFDGGMKIYDWNAGTETYDYVDSYAVDVASVMIDALERIWVLDTASQLHMFSATTPIRITVAMENDSYNYTGSTINTYANVSAWNTDGDRVAANVKLVLEGSAEFTDASKSKTFATSASAETQININITGSSYSRAVASVVV